MDRTQAAEISKHMLRAAKAVNRASEIIFALDEEDREVLSAPLLEIIDALHFKLLRAVYIRYSELRPPDPGDQGSTRHGDGKTLFFLNPSPRLISITRSFRP